MYASRESVAYVDFPGKFHSHEFSQHFLPPSENKGLLVNMIRWKTNDKNQAAMYPLAFVLVVLFILLSFSSFMHNSVQSCCDYILFCKFIFA